MKSITMQELAPKQTGLWEKLKKNGPVILTKNGKPEGIFISVSDATWFEDMQDILMMQAKRATSEARKLAMENDLDSMRMEEIDAEIKSVRKERKG